MRKCDGVYNKCISGRSIMLPEYDMVDESAYDNDREYLNRLYPAKARLIMVMIEDECDKLEYEGSPMFAMYPDKETVLRIAGDIFMRIGSRDEALKQMIEILLVNEFFVRRCRYKRRRKFF